MKRLHVGTRLDWPPELAAEATGLLGTRGAGKSNLARVVVEECYRAGIPCVVFDPIGNWYGIRAGRDGRPAGGLPFVIFGGPHGDVPLEPTKGAELADTVVDVRLNCVLDLSHQDLSEGDKRRFLRDFGDRLFRRKQPETGWMLLVFEEVDDYAPQSPRGEQAATLAVFQKLVKRGRFKGLGALLVTQRSAAVNKDLLNMIGTLVAFRTPAPRDRDAIADWMKHHSVGAEAVSTLHELAPGEAWVWSPELLGTLERVRFRRMETYDTGATPKHVAGAAARKPATLADVDIPALRERFKVAIERAKAEDPRELQRQVAQLKAELARAAKAAAPAPAPKVVERKVPALDRKTAALVAKAIERFDAWAASVTGRLQQDLRDVRDDLDALARVIARRVPTEISPALPPAGRGIAALIPDRPLPTTGAMAALALPTLDPPLMGGPDPRRAGRGGHPARPPSSSAAPGGGLRRMLIALAQRPQGLTRQQLGVRAALSSRSGTFDTYLSRARSEGWLVNAGHDGRLQVTDAGLEALGDFQPLPTGQALLAHWLRELGGGAARMLQALAEVYPRTLTRDQVGEGAGLSARSGTFDTYLSRLRTLELVTGKAELRASDELFDVS